GTDDAGDYWHFVANDVVKQQCLVGLINECCDMPAVHWLLDVDQFLFRAQAIEKFAKGFVGIRRFFHFFFRSPVPAGAEMPSQRLMVSCSTSKRSSTRPMV